MNEKTEQKAEDLTVVLADDHRLTRETLEQILESHPGWRVVGLAEDGEQAVELVSRCEPDVVVMDVVMPRMAGPDAVRKIMETHGGVAVVMVSNHTNPGFVRQAVRAGAKGYISKEKAFEELIPAVRSVAGNQRYFGRGIEPVTR